VFRQRLNQVVVNFEILKWLDGGDFLRQASNHVLRQVDVEELLTEQIEAHEFQIHARHLEVRLL
jgi:hypothetical protein